MGARERKRKRERERERERERDAELRAPADNRDKENMRTWRQGSWIKFIDISTKHEETVQRGSPYGCSSPRTILVRILSDREEKLCVAKLAKMPLKVGLIMKRAEPAAPKLLEALIYAMADTINDIYSWLDA